MKVEMTSHYTFLNGSQVPSNDMSKLVFGGFAHFTSLQVRNRMAKGLDLHLERLHQASIKLFNQALPHATIRSCIRQAIESGPADHSLSVTLFSPNGEFTAQSMNITPHVLVKTTDPLCGPVGPLRLMAISHERPLAEIKHVGEIGKTYYLHQAIKQGFDDAVFVNKNGDLSEGTIWNLAFWDGNSVVWPKARMLKGTMMSMIQRQLSQLNITQRYESISIDNLADFKGAALLNSLTPGVEVCEIGSTRFQLSPQLLSILHRAYALELAEPV
ncbi:aminotransferase class IV family protein [Pseudoalteromonas sp. SMS1]|uniref:aminotransferase class IV family protein n=1 Tax=Pseudoalteromonas sp. SMS1 TaxID=2908894 RepID=UPI001F1AFB5A|nr:aminotransferase class IV family protein [Pseudoalteromonas sp. SMS1]MCF2860143.1 aminotransferase class IV family protein [Pseudoalteromonas sp. SMS1]